MNDNDIVSRSVPCLPFFKNPEYRHIRFNQAEGDSGSFPYAQGKRNCPKSLHWPRLYFSCSLKKQWEKYLERFRCKQSTVKNTLTHERYSEVFFYTEEVSNTASSKKTTADLRWEISFCKRFVHATLHVRHAVSPLGVLGVYSKFFLSSSP